MRSDVPQRRSASPKTGFECQYSPALGNEDLPVRGYRFVLHVKKKLRTVDIYQTKYSDTSANEDN